MIIFEKVNYMSLKPRVEKIITPGRIQKKASQRSEPIPKFPKPRLHAQPLMQEPVVSPIDLDKAAGTKFTMLQYEVDDLTTAKKVGSPQRLVPFDKIRLPQEGYDARSYTESTENQLALDLLNDPVGLETFKSDQSTPRKSRPPIIPESTGLVIGRPLFEDRYA